MAETLTKAAKSQDAERAQEKKRQLESAPVFMKALADESVPFAGLLGVSAMELPVERHAALLGDPRFSHSVNNSQKAGLITELQQNYGNAYVQRVVSRFQAKKDKAIPEEEQDIVDIGQRIAQEKGSGKSLEPETRSEMEAAFGEDFSGVRMHTNSEADRLSKELGAKAFTSGKDIFFREGAYQPTSEAGKGLLGHELAHVMQQSAAPILQRQAAAGSAGAEAGEAKEEVSEEEAKAILPSNKVIEDYWKKRKGPGGRKWAAEIHEQVDQIFWQDFKKKAGYKIDPKKEPTLVKAWFRILAEVLSEEGEEEGEEQGKAALPEASEETEIPEVLLSIFSTLQTLGLTMTQLIVVYRTMRLLGFSAQEMLPIFRHMIKLGEFNPDLLARVVEGLSSKTGALARTIKVLGAVGIVATVIGCLVEVVIAISDGTWGRAASAIYRCVMSIAIPWAALIDAIQGMLSFIDPTLGNSPIWKILRAINPIALGGIAIDTLVTIVEVCATEKEIIPHLDRLVARMRAAGAGFFVDIGEWLGITIYDILHRPPLLECPVIGFGIARTIIIESRTIETPIQLQWELAELGLRASFQQTYLDLQGIVGESRQKDVRYLQQGFNFWYTEAYQTFRKQVIKGYGDIPESRLRPLDLHPYGEVIVNSYFDEIIRQTILPNPDPPGREVIKAIWDSVIYPEVAQTASAY